MNRIGEFFASVAERRRERGHDRRQARMQKYWAEASQLLDPILSARDRKVAALAQYKRAFGDQHFGYRYGSSLGTENAWRRVQYASHNLNRLQKQYGQLARKLHKLGAPPLPEPLPRASTASLPPEYTPFDSGWRAERPGPFAAPQPPRAPTAPRAPAATTSPGVAATVAAVLTHDDASISMQALAQLRERDLAGLTTLAAAKRFPGDLYARLQALALDPSAYRLALARVHPDKLCAFEAELGREAYAKLLRSADILRHAVTLVHDEAMARTSTERGARRTATT